MRVAAIDCGTNSIRLLIADHDEGAGTLTEVVRRMEVVRLGEGVEATGRLDSEALGRTLDMCREYAEECREHRVAPGRVRFVATSATRDACNAEDFVVGVREAFGELDVTPEVITGDEEAALSFAGATGGLTEAGLEGPFLVVDLGGGSTEMARGKREVVAGRSFDIGCVRLTERHLRSDPPLHAQIDDARNDIAEVLDTAEAEVGLGGISTLVGLAGSVTTVTAQALGLTSYDPQAIHHAEVTSDQMMRAAEDLLISSRDERAAMPFMHPGRVDVIGAGALIWHEIVARTLSANGNELVVTASEKDILDGIALSVVIAPTGHDRDAD